MQLSLCLAGLTGIGDGLTQSSLYGYGGRIMFSPAFSFNNLIGMFPPKYMGAITGGNGVAGVVVSILRIATKAMYPNDTTGLRKSAM